MNKKNEEQRDEERDDERDEGREGEEAHEREEADEGDEQREHEAKIQFFGAMTLSDEVIREFLARPLEEGMVSRLCCTGCCSLEQLTFHSFMAAVGYMHACEELGDVDLDYVANHPGEYYILADGCGRPECPGGVKLVLKRMTEQENFVIEG